MNDGQWLYRGRTFGDGTNETTTQVRIGSAEVRDGVSLLPQDHGGIHLDAWHGARDVELEIASYWSTKDDAWQAWVEWHGLMQTGDTVHELRYQPYGDPVERLVFVRPDQPQFAWEGGMRTFRGRLRWVAADPAIYAADETVAVIVPFVPSGAAPYGTVYPKVYGTAADGTSASVENVGNWPSWPKFVIEGPPSGTLTLSTLENLTTGGIVQFSSGSPLTVSAGSTLVIDMHPARRVVQFTDGASRIDRVVDLDSWWQVRPGVNDLRVRASGNTTDSAVSVRFRSAWL